MASLKKAPGLTLGFLANHKKKSAAAALLSALAVWKWQTLKTVGGAVGQFLSMLKMIKKMEETQRKASQKKLVDQLVDQFSLTQQVAEQLCPAFVARLLVEVDRFFAVDDLHLRIKQLRESKRLAQQAGAPVESLNEELETEWGRFKIASLARSVAASYATAFATLLVRVQTCVVRRQSFTRAHLRSDTSPMEGSVLASLGLGGDQTPASPEGSDFENLDVELMQFLRQCTDSLSLTLVQDALSSSAERSPVHRLCEVVASCTREVAAGVSLESETSFPELWALMERASAGVARRLGLGAEAQERQEAQELSVWGLVSKLFGSAEEEGGAAREPWSSMFIPSPQRVAGRFQAQMNAVHSAGRAHGGMENAPRVGIELSDPLVWEVAIGVGLPETQRIRDGLRSRLVNHALTAPDEVANLLQPLAGTAQGEAFRLLMTPEDLEELLRRREGGEKVSALAGREAPLDPNSPAAISLEQARLERDPQRSPEERARHNAMLHQSRMLQFGQFLLQESVRGQDLSAEVRCVLQVPSAGALVSEIVRDAILPTFQVFLKQGFESLAAKQGKSSIPFVLCLMAQTGAYKKFALGGPAVSRSALSYEPIQDFCKVIFFPISSPPVFEDPEPEPEQPEGMPGLGDDQQLRELMMSLTGGDGADLDSLLGLAGFQGGKPDIVGAEAAGDDLMSWLRPQAAPRIELQQD